MRLPFWIQIQNVHVDIGLENYNFCTFKMSTYIILVPNTEVIPY